MKYRILLILIILITIIGCEKVSSTQESSIKISKNEEISKDEKKEEVKTNPSFKPFYIYSDKGSRENHYTPSGFMPNGDCIKIDDRWVENCQSGSSCIKVSYDIECSKNDQKWGGIYWLNPPNNWGKRKGGYNLTGAAKLTFWARGESGGEQINEFTIGGITGDYPDTDTIVMGPVILMPEWKQYTIDLRGKDLSYISGGFSWTTSEEVNPETCVFYIDDIKFE